MVLLNSSLGAKIVENQILLRIFSFPYCFPGLMKRVKCENETSYRMGFQNTILCIPQRRY